MNFTKANDFFAAILDSMTQQIAVIEPDGAIAWVNKAWRFLAEENGGTPEKTWRNVNYLTVCESAARTGDADAALAQDGIDKVITGKLPVFYFEYPCHSPKEQRWFMMRILPLEWDGPKRFLVTHQNITERKLTEFRVEELAILDGLTGIANRRRFDEFLESEWRRARRYGHPVSLALIDIDYFKPYNDLYGHMAGDECLRRISDILKGFSRRPEDLVARYGGEEFAAVYGNMSADAANQLAESIRQKIEQQNIPHGCGTASGCVTASVGVATFYPDREQVMKPSDLITAADKALYRAKESGRNRVCVHEAVGS